MKRTVSSNFLLCCVAAMAVATSADAAVILTTNSYSEDFDSSLSSTSVTGAFSSTVGVQAAIPAGGSSSGWVGAKIAGTGTANMNFTVDNGGANSGAIYSYGSTGSGERALGALASGSNTAAIGVELVNNTGDEITKVAIKYLGEYWRSSTSTQNVLTFGYSVGASGSTSFLTAAATGLAALDLVGPAPVQSNGALDGNLPANQMMFSGMISATVPQGQSLYLRWSDFNDVGNDAGLAIDNFMVSVVPEPASLALIGVGILAVAGLVRRRS